MRLQEVVHEPADGLEVEFGGGVRVHHRGVVDVLAVAGEDGLHGQLLDVDVGAHHRRELQGQLADVGGLQAVLVHEAGDLDAAAFGQVLDEAGVEDVAVDHAGFAGLAAVDDARAVLLAAPHGQGFVLVLELAAQLLPVLDLGFAAAQVLVDRDLVALDQLGPPALDEPRHVLAEVLAGFGDEVAEVPEGLVAHAVGELPAVLGAEVALGQAAALEELAQLRVHVLALVLELQVEGHVVDARHHVVEFPVGDAEVVGEFVRGALHAVAEADHGHAAGAAQGQAVHGHGVDVVEVHDVGGADPLHDPGVFQQHRDGAQAPHDAADAEGVGDGLLQAVLLGDLEVDHGGGLVAAHLDHADGVVGALERLFRVGGGLDGWVDAEGLGDLACDDLGGAQAFGVDVEQHEVRVLQFRVGEDVADQVLGEHGAARADEGDLGSGLWHAGPFGLRVRFGVRFGQGGCSCVERLGSRLGARAERPPRRAGQASVYVGRVRESWDGQPNAGVFQ